MQMTYQVLAIYLAGYAITVILAVIYSARSGWGFDTLGEAVSSVLFAMIYCLAWPIIWIVAIVYFLVRRFTK